MSVTHYFIFSDVTAAKAALPTYWKVGPNILNPWFWDTSRVDAQIPILQADGVYP
jgi:hypothetical protein